MKTWQMVVALGLAGALGGCASAPATAPAPADAAVPAATTPALAEGDRISAEQTAAVGHDATTSTQRADDSDGALPTDVGALGGGGGAADVDGTREWGADGAEEEEEIIPGEPLSGVDDD